MSCRAPFLRLFLYAAFSVSILNIFTKATSIFFWRHGPSQSSLHRLADNIVCSQSELANDIVVILRTGATESQQKVPVHLRTALRCVPKFTIFSDFDEEIEGHQVYDVLKGVSEQTRKENTDFQLYNRLQEHGQDGSANQKVTTGLSGSFKGEYLRTDNPGWQLDKWKFLPMIDQALERHPDAKWYVFIEADTYLGWNNLLAYLSAFDHERPYYIGKHLYINNVEFGYGGAGFVLSGPAMRKVSTQRSTRIAEYEEFTRTHWVGECGLGKVLQDVQIPLHHGFPHFQGDSPATLSPATEKLDRHLWCHPAITFHHVSPTEIDELWQFEQNWYKRHDIVLRHRDIFHEFIHPKIAPSVPAWDNMADETVYTAHENSASSNRLERDAWKSFEHCRALCDELKDCVQFSFDTGTCGTSKTFRLGYAKEGERIRSGWIMNRVDDLFRNMEQKCGVTDWFAPARNERVELKVRRRKM